MKAGPITSWQIDEETMETVTDFIFLGSKITTMVTAAIKLKRHLLLGRKNHNKSRQHIKKQRHYFANKGLSSQSYGFSSSHVWMWKLDHKGGWVPKNWCFCSPWGHKESDMTEQLNNNDLFKCMSQSLKWVIHQSIPPPPFLPPLLFLLRTLTKTVTWSQKWQAILHPFAYFISHTDLAH